MGKKIHPIIPKQHAGKLLTSLVPVVDEKATILDVERLLVRKAREFETINYIYVVDGAWRLLGAVPSDVILRVLDSAAVAVACFGAAGRDFSVGAAVGLKILASPAVRRF